METGVITISIYYEKIAGYPLFFAGLDTVIAGMVDNRHGCCAGIAGRCVLSSVQGRQGQPGFQNVQVPNHADRFRPERIADGGRQGQPDYPCGLFSPQIQTGLINVLKGDMSVVGPRPEVRKYVDLYTPEQMRVLSVRPGLTDIASIQYVHEDEILAASDNPEQTYIQEVMPAKLALNLQYIDTQSLWGDIKLIWKTFTAILH